MGPGGEIESSVVYGGRQSRVDLALGLASLLFSLPRVAREAVLMGDSAQLVSAAAVLGVPTAPGYPLYTLLTHLALLVPVGGVAMRAHLTSALYHALAVGLTARTTREITGSVPAAICTAGFLIFSRIFLLGSLYAEVLALSDLLFAAMLWSSAAASRAGLERRGRLLLGCAAVSGLAVAHHPALLLGLPSVLAVIARPLVSWARERPVRAAGFAAAFVVPVLVSVALLWVLARRDAPLSFGDVHDLRSLVSVLLRADHGGLLSTSPQPATISSGERIGAMVLLLGRSVGVQGLVTGVLGIFALLKSDRPLSVALLAAVVLPGPVLAAQVSMGIEGEAGASNFERLFSVVHVPLAVLSGVGAQAVARRLVERLGKRVRVPRGAEIALVVLPGLSLAPGAWSIDLSEDRFGAALAADIVRDVPKGSLVLVSGDIYAGAAELSCTLGRACDELVVIAPGRLHWPWARAQASRRHPDLALPEGKMVLSRTHELVRAELGRRPVFVVPGLLVRDRALAKGFAFAPHGVLLRVYPDVDSARAARDTTLASVRGLASGERCGGCGLDPGRALRPSPHMEVLLAYSVALENGARYANTLGASAESHALFQRARAFDEAIGINMVRLGLKQE